MDNIFSEFWKNIIGHNGKIIRIASETQVIIQQRKAG